MNPAQLQLRDIHLPDPVGWWPLAPGWWLLIVLSIALIAVSIWLLLRWHRHPVTSALRELNQQKARSMDDKAWLTESSVLLRRVAMALYGRQMIAQACAAQWQQLLQTQGSGLSDDSVALFVRGQWQAEVAFDRQQLEAEVRRWLKSQRSLLAVIQGKTRISQGVTSDV